MCRCINISKFARPIQKDAQMSTVVNFRQVGRVVALSCNGAPLPKELDALVEDALTYYEQTYSPGDGVMHLQRELFGRTDNGLIICGAGFRPKLAQLLIEKGCTVTVEKEPWLKSAVFTPDWSLLPPNFKFRHRQDELMAALVSAEFGVIISPTGTGKSTMLRLYCRVMSRPRIAYITKSSDICNAMHRELSMGLGERVGRVGDGKYVVERVSVINADSIDRAGYDWDVVFGDEAHELAAPTYVDKLARFRRAKMFALTASWRRKDNRHNELEGIFGPVLFEMPYEEASENNMVLPITVEWIRAPLVYDPGAGMPVGAARERLSVWRNDERNKVLADRVMQCPADKQILVMARTVEHVYALREFLPDFAVCYAPKNDNNEIIMRMRDEGLMRPDEKPVSAKDRRKMGDDFAAGKLKHVISNYVWSTGVDYKQLSIIARADASGGGTKDTQIPGRVCRTLEGKSEALVIDMWDDFSMPLLDRSKARKRIYDAHKWRQLGLPQKPKRSR